jgi:hypothetical protein
MPVCGVLEATQTLGTPFKPITGPRYSIFGSPMDLLERFYWSA